jgi:hypothetical protein
MSETMSSAVNGEILSSVQKQELQMNDLKGSLISMTDNINIIKQDTSKISDMKTNLVSFSQHISELKSDLNNSMSVKFIEFKNDYISGIKSLLNENENSDKSDIMNLIDRNNEIFLDKTKLLFNDTITKDIAEHNQYISSLLDNNGSSLIDKTRLLLVDNQDKYMNQVDVTLKTFQSSLSDELKCIDNKSDGDVVRDFVASFETKCSTMFQTVQQPIYSVLQACEDRIQSNIQVIKDATIITQSKNNATMDDLSLYLKKFNNSSYKGALGEIELEAVLNHMYSSAEIINTSGTKSCGDFMLKRDNKPNIMFENKVYETNVKYEEIGKFIRDVEEIHTHAIFLSQNSGITRKKNYQVDLHKGCILVYIHNVQYCPEKIQIAIDIIENLAERIDELNCEEDDENIISKYVLDEINKEYMSFSKQKSEIILMSRDYQKKLVGQLESLKMDALNKYLSTKYATNDKSGYTCEYCNNFTTPTKKSLSAHVRACKKPHEPLMLINEHVTNTHNGQ